MSASDSERRPVLASVRNVLGWFRYYWKRHRGPFALVVAITVVAVATRTAYPLLFKFVIDALVTTDAESSRSPAFWVWVMVGVGFGQQVLQWLLPSTRAWVNVAIARTIRSRLFARVLRKRADFFTRYRSGDLVARLTDDIDGFDKLQWYSCSGIMRPIEAILILTFSLAVIATLDWQLTLWSCLPLPFVVWILSRSQRLQRRLFRERQDRVSETTDVLESSFKGVRILLSFVAERSQAQLFDRTLVDREGAERRLLTVRAILEGAGALLNQIGVIVVIFLGGHACVNGRISVGDFYAFMSYLTSMTQPIWTLSWFFVSTNFIEASVDRIVEVERIPERRAGETTPERLDRLTLESVTFRYPNGPCIVEAIDLTVERGERVVMVGAVGSGKTTLLELATGTLEPEGGRVRIGGVPVEEIDDQTRSVALGYVPQETILFSGSIGENVTLGRDLDDDRVAASLEVAGLRGELGTERQIAQGGVGLSGGQRARACLARAVASRPAFLVLDDVTSALDARTEEVFWSELGRRLPETGVLVSTHREATARTADRVVWLHRGRIREIGRHEELLRRHSEYGALFARSDPRSEPSAAVESTES